MNIKVYAPKRAIVADYVKCYACGKTMLTQCGTANCPACGAIDSLMWADADQHEVNVKEFKEFLRNKE